MLSTLTGLQPQPTIWREGSGRRTDSPKTVSAPQTTARLADALQAAIPTRGGCKAPLPPGLPGAPHRAGGPSEGPGLGAQRRGYCGFCGERERMGLSPGGSRGAPHAWSRLPVGGRNGKALAEGKSEEAWLVMGELFFSHPHGGRFHPTSAAAFPAPYPFLSCPEAPETKTSYLTLPASTSCSTEPRWSPPNTPTHTHDLPDSVQPTRSRSPYFVPFEPPSISLLSCLRMTHFLPFPLFPALAPALVPPSSPSTLLPAARPRGRGGPRSSVPHPAARSGVGGPGRGRGGGEVRAGVHRESAPRPRCVCFPFPPER